MERHAATILGLGLLALLGAGGPATAAPPAAIELTSPSAAARATGELPRFASPLALQWSAVGDETVYVLRVADYRDASHGAGAGEIGEVMSKTLAGPDYFMRLPESPPHTHYRLWIEARTLDGTVIGALRVAADGGSADYLAFRVE